MGNGKLAAGAAALLLASGVPERSGALAFDVIVPGIVEMNTASSFGTSPAVWGWVISTTAPISRAELEGAVFQLSFSDPGVVVTPGMGIAVPPGFPGFTGLSPGEVAGSLIAQPSTDNSAYNLLLQGGELLVSPPIFWQTAFSYPFEYVGTGTLNATVEVGGAQISYTTEIRFLNTGPRFLVVEGQRLSAIPEPASAVLVGGGTLLLAGVRRAGTRRSMHGR